MFKKIIYIITILFFIATALMAQQKKQDGVYQRIGSVIEEAIIKHDSEISFSIQKSDRNKFANCMNKVSKFTRKPGEDKSKEKIRGKKLPVLACALSCFFPGVGQYYNGDVTKGLIQEGLFMFGAVLWAVNTGKSMVTFQLDETDLILPMIILSGAYLWSIIDAPLSAIKINKEREKQYGHLLEFDQGNYVIGFDLAPTRQGFGAKLSYHF